MYGSGIFLCHGLLPSTISRPSQRDGLADELSSILMVVMV